MGFEIYDLKKRKKMGESHDPENNIRISQIILYLGCLLFLGILALNSQGSTRYLSIAGCGIVLLAMYYRREIAEAFDELFRR